MIAVAKSGTTMGLEANLIGLFGVKGMPNEDLNNNLGTVAKSDTAGADASLIGQFGVEVTDKPVLIDGLGTVAKSGTTLGL